MAEEMQNSAPVSEANSPEPVQSAPKSGSKNMLVLFSLVLIFAIILLAAGGYVYLISKNKSAAPVYTQAVPTSTPTQTPSPTGVTRVSSSSDVDSTLNEVTRMSDADLQNDLNLANSEGSNL